MRSRSRAAIAAAVGAAVVFSGLGAAPASAVGTITCSVAPGNPVLTMMSTPVSGQVTCVNSEGAPVSYRLLPYQADVRGPSSGKLSFDAGTGGFQYLPGFYPPDEKGVQDPLPEFTGSDDFVVEATSPDGAATQFAVPIEIGAPGRGCDPNFVAATRTMFNNPAGNEAEQYQMLRYLIDMIDCTPPTNPDGSQASIKFSFYSLSYPPVQAALSRAAARGVSVQALTNSHADKYPAWKQLAKTVGGDTRAASFAATCWAGCITPRSAPTPGGPTAWYSAEATSLSSRTVVFSDRSLQGTAPIVRWQWDFGDGDGAEGPGPHSHTYRKEETYKTSLTVTDANGVVHKVSGDRTLPDSLEPMYPSLHSKIYLFSTVGTGAAQRRWVSAYSSGNPTYFQSRKGFNNLNIAVEDQALYDIFATYFSDMVKASRGEIMTPNYFRSFASPGNPASGARPTTVHLLPQTEGDINREILQSVQCLYKEGKKTRHTTIRVSVFVFTRKGVASDLWQLAMRKGCRVEVVYTQMSQRVKGSNGKWLADEDGNVMGYGVADCLATPARKRGVGACASGTLRGKVPVTSSGRWLNRKGRNGGRLVVRMSCPVAPKYDPVKKRWSVLCIRNDIFTHHKMMLIDGIVRGSRQQYVMTGSANWSGPGLRDSDEIVTEIQNAPQLYAEYLANYNYMKRIVSQNSRKKKRKAKTYMIQAAGDATIDVRGMTDEQLRGQD